MNPEYTGQSIAALVPAPSLPCVAPASLHDPAVVGVSLMIAGSYYSGLTPGTPARLTAKLAGPASICVEDVRPVTAQM